MVSTFDFWVGPVEKWYFWRARILLKSGPDPPEQTPPLTSKSEDFKGGLLRPVAGGPFLDQKHQWNKGILGLEFFPLRVQKRLVLPVFLAPIFAFLRFSIQNRKSTINVMVF